jgi:hypothetical protein
MKKILSVVLSVIVCASIFTPILTFAVQEKIPNCCLLSSDITLDTLPAGGCLKGTYAGSEDICNLSGLAPSCPTKSWGLACLLSSITLITDWVFGFVLSLVVIFILYGAFKLLKSGGDPKKTGEGRLMIVYAAVGMIVALLAKAIPSLVRTILG